MEPWEGIVQIPEQQINDYAIEHFTKPPGAVARSNIRTAMFGGQAEEPVVFDRETQWHRLTYEGGTWMTDLPIEQQQHDNELAEITSGAVLIGGLGIGYAANVLAARPKIHRIVVVEISREVVEMVAPHLKDPENKIQIVTGDLMDFVKANIEVFDHAFYDIWQSDGEGTFHNLVVPLRRHSWPFVDDQRIVCWNENVMRGQLVNSLQSRMLFYAFAALKQIPIAAISDLAKRIPDNKPGASYWNWMVPFWQAVESGTVPHALNERFMKFAGAYAGTYGLDGWERWWELTTGIKTKISV